MNRIRVKKALNTGEAQNHYVDLKIITYPIRTIKTNCFDGSVKLRRSLHVIKVRK